jgi:hypothetical protein
MSEMAASPRSPADKKAVAEEVESPVSETVEAEPEMTEATPVETEALEATPAVEEEVKGEAEVVEEVAEEAASATDTSVVTKPSENAARGEAAMKKRKTTEAAAELPFQPVEAITEEKLRKVWCIGVPGPWCACLLGSVCVCMCASGGVA